MGEGGRHRCRTDLSTTPWLSAKWENTDAVGTQRGPLTQAEGGQGRLPGGEHHLHGPWRKSGLNTVSMSVMAALKTPRVVQGLPWWPSDKDFTFQCRCHGFDPLSCKIPLVSWPKYQNVKNKNRSNIITDSMKTSPY